MKLFCTLLLSFVGLWFICPADGSDTTGSGKKQVYADTMQINLLFCPVEEL